MVSGRADPLVTQKTGNGKVDRPLFPPVSRDARGTAIQSYSPFYEMSSTHIVRDS